MWLGSLNGNVSDLLEMLVVCEYAIAYAENTPHMLKFAYIAQISAYAIAFFQHFVRRLATLFD